MTAFDTPVIQLAGSLAVHGQRQEVMFRDGSTVALHCVSASQVPQLFLRAVVHTLPGQGTRWVAFDLRTMGPELEADVLRLHARDTPGVVFFTLRSRFKSAGEFMAAAVAEPVATWWPTTDPQRMGAAA